MKPLVVGPNGKTGELAKRKATPECHEVVVFGRSVEQRYKSDPVGQNAGRCVRQCDCRRCGYQSGYRVGVSWAVNLRDRVTLTQSARHICKAMQPHMRQCFAPLA